jgi:acyl-CoA thioesterase FadM
MRWIRLFSSMLRARFRKPLRVTGESQIPFHVWITDIDVSVMNHAAVMTVFETGRIDFMVRTGFFRLATRNKWYVPSSAISVQFFRPLKMFQKAIVCTRLFHIDDRWIYLEQLIFRHGKEMAGCVVKSTVKSGREYIRPSVVLQRLGVSGIESEGSEMVRLYDEENSLMRERLANWIDTKNRTNALKH